MRDTGAVGLILGFALCVQGCTVASIEASAQSQLSSVIDQQAITTSFADTDKSVVLPDSLGNDQSFQQVRTASESADGALALPAGFYSIDVRSYCLHAGAAGPSTGEGYLYAPLKGPSADVIGGILRGTFTHPQIPQQDVQTMIWAILAHAKLGQLSTTMQAEAAQLLTPAQLAELDTGGLPALEQAALQKMINSAPESVREGLALENKLRAALSDSSTSYADLERLAVPPPLPVAPDSVPAGRWSRHPGGYFVRYVPHSYTSVTVQVYVPAAPVGRVTSPSGFAMVASSGPLATLVSFLKDVAVPANTQKQKLGLSNVPVAPPAGAPPPPPAPKPDCDKQASDSGPLNYGVPWGKLDEQRPGHDPNYDISSDPPGAGAQRDAPVFLSLRPSIDMDYVNGKGGTSISGTGDAQLTGATVFTSPWRPNPNQDGTPGFNWGGVVSVNAQYSYTKSDGTTGSLTFYIEYLHLITPEYPALNDNGTAIAPPAACVGFGPSMRNGKKLSPSDVANRPLIGFLGATQTPHVHVQARLADGSVGGLLKGPLVDPTIVLNGDH
jgi:hypothetical protein